jgi:serine protease SohB
MSDILTNYFSFFAKVATVVLGFLVVLIGMAILTRKKRRNEGRIELKNMGDHYKKIKEDLQREIFSKDELKAESKKDKEKAKEEKGRKENKPRLFVLHFDGDMRAQAVCSLREEVSALLSVLSCKDEVFLKLESPGGIVPGYGLAAGQLKRIRDRNIPLTISVDKVAASGGYMMACQGHKILAAPFAILGSIGVLAQIPNFNRLLKKNNIDFEQITGGEFKRTLTMFGENTEKGREKFQEEVNSTHELFKNFVMEARPQLDMAKVATGEHWYGSQALELKLVDAIQTSDDYLLERYETHDIYELKFEEESKGFGKKISEILSRKVRDIFYPGIWS